MRRSRRLAVAAMLLLLVAGLAAAFGMLNRERPRVTATERPQLLLLTSLPLLFGEGFSLENHGSPAFTALEEHYRVHPISIADRQSLDGGRLLLMAQPQAQTAEALVDLDHWVRSGGRVLVLADPLLEWSSSLPLGDVHRPATAFADTGLLAHWGLRLDLPLRRGPASFAIDGKTVRALSPGRLVSVGPDCAVKTGGVIARCRLGKGRATIIADADFIDADRHGAVPGSENLSALVRELQRLQH